MKIQNEFGVDVPVERAWAALTDLESLAPCMPGAQLTGVDGEVYKGRVKIKVGPVISQFAGTAHFVEKDEAARRAVISAAGKDARGGGNASATIHAQLHPEGGGTRVSVATDLNISGKLAQFGAGMIKEISEKLLTQFVHNLEQQLHATPERPADEPAPQPPAAAGAAAAAASMTTKEEPSPASAGASGAAAPAGPAAGGTSTAGGGQPVGDGTAPAAAASSGSRAAPEVAGTGGETAAAGGSFTSSSAPAPEAGPVETLGGARGPLPSGGHPEAAPSRNGSGPAAGLAAEPAVPPSEPHPSTAASSSYASPSSPSSAAGPKRGTSAEPSGASLTGTRPVGTDSSDDSDDGDALDLMQLAGSSVYKRLIPVVVGALVIIGLVIWLMVR
jgi:carbon monoxide dehydrogenase subunit G